MVKISAKLKLLMLISKAEAIISRKFQSQGLSFIDVMVLHSISEAPEQKMRCVDLADQVGLTASGVTRLLAPLEKFGVIKRVTNEHDARSSHIVLTNSGKTMLKDAVNIMSEQCEDLIQTSKYTELRDANRILKLIAG